jgi:hypothetical protein
MKPTRPPFVTFFCLGALLWAVPFARAQAIADNFNDGNDAGWTRVNPLGNAIYTFPGGSSYRLQAPISPDTGTFGPARAGAVRTDTSFGDFTITVDLVDWDNSSSTHQAIGIIARAGQLGAGTTDGYFLHYDPFGSSGQSRLWIDGITDEMPFGSASVAMSPLNAGLDYRLEFLGVGSSLTGRIYALSNLSTVLYEVVWSDATYLSGYAGLLVADQGALASGNQSGDATFDNFSAVAAIPEPSTYALLTGLGALCLAMVRRRRAA